MTAGSMLGTAITNTLAVAEVDLTAAQISDLHDNPIVLAPAPGEGKGYRVLGFMISFRWGTTGYSSSDGRIQTGPLQTVLQDYTTWETVLSGTGDGDGAHFMASGPDDQSPSGDWVVEIHPVRDQETLISPDLIDNQPLVVGNPGTDFVDGDGTMKVTVHYAIFEL